MIASNGIEYLRHAKTEQFRTDKFEAGESHKVGSEKDKLANEYGSVWKSINDSKTPSRPRNEDDQDEDDDTHVEARKGLDIIHKTPLYNKSKGLTRVDPFVKIRNRNKGYFDQQKRDHDLWRSRNLRSIDSQMRRTVNPNTMKKFFEQELHHAERRQWWGNDDDI